MVKIKRTFCIFDRLAFAFDCMGINHGCSDITVSRQFLNRSDRDGPVLFSFTVIHR